MTEIPLRRFTARVLPVDSHGRVLLLRGFDPARPDAPYWFTIGGAAEEAETLEQAAARELFEEVGITAAPESFGRPLETHTVEFSFGDRAYVQDQTYFPVRVDAAEVRFDHMEEIELATTLGHHWWGADELESSGDVYYPEILPSLIRKAATPG
ncbi:NUDIX hydrolase [Nonomuraea africana]|uniref:8-oxo-dGTP pyrophosphatase MutT (NUDIX family) n=1 Tax=Nonomuraea africana TaxID=46171 RepID=A0ABR9KSM4_9ACTN|nr:NUDIX domain-containing protein [Nonomuraea africana]MBE1565043.1 8-oxo-dGTP pyrophosphatase MutT (NUDIX family) [Nonomuraea africana]